VDIVFFTGSYMPLFVCIKQMIALAAIIFFKDSVLLNKLLK